jgi:hypothetical protein
MEENIMYELLLTKEWALVGFYNAHNLLKSNVYELRRQKGCQDLQFWTPEGFEEVYW